MSHTLDALAWTLIHFCWQAAAVAVVYRVSSFFLAYGASRTRYALSLAAMLLMVAGALGTFAWEMYAATASPTLPSAAAEVRNVALRAVVAQKLESGMAVLHETPDASSQMNQLRSGAVVGAQHWRMEADPAAAGNGDR
jgi:hypothetical protein